jgi:uncharacterized protein (TIGR03663 family)
MGVLLIGLLALLHDGLGRRATLATAVLLAASPAFVFYSRYFIQEILLVCFTVGALGCWWRYVQTSSGARVVWLLMAGAFVGMMIATKETAAISLGAWFIAVLLTGMRRSWKPAIGALAAAAVVAALILTDFARNPVAVVDYFRSYAPWLGRVHGTGLHRHGWAYYLAIMAGLRTGASAWSEVLIPGLALLGLARVVVAGRRGLRQAQAPELGGRIAIWTVVVLAVYSASPYKTPWCLLSPLLGMALVGGMGFAWAMDGLESRSRRAGAFGWALFLVAAGLLGRQAWSDAYRHQTDPRNPYVYAQTVPDAEDIQKRAETLAAFHPDGTRMVIKVIWTDDYYWPIPWYLRRFPNVGYWSSMPEDADAPLVLAAPAYDEELTRRLDATHLMNGYIGLRPQVVTMVWVRMDLWTRYVEHLQKTRREGGESGSN